MILIKQWSIAVSDWKLANFLINKKLQTSDLVYIATIVLVISLLYSQWNIRFFSRRGIKTSPGMLPFFGNIFNLLLKREHLRDLHERTYRSHPGEKYVGEMHLNHPFIVLKDIDLIKEVTVTKFDHFTDHTHFVDPDTDPMLSNIIFSLRGDKWRDMRSRLTPVFTSSKIRDMFSFIEQTSLQAADTFTKKFDQRKASMDIEVLDVFGRYMNDVIATTAFGLIIDSLSTPDNKFYEMGKFSSNLTHMQALKYLLSASYPKIMKIFGIQVLDEKVKHFFRSLVLNTMKFREKEKIFRPDMLQLLNEARKGSLKCDDSMCTSRGNICPNFIQGRKEIHWTDDDVVAQAMLFFIAGFDNTSNMLCYIVYELMRNPSAQRKLHREIDRIVAKKGSKRISYDDLADLKYMDAVINETLRLWPSAIATDRECTKSFKLPPTSKNDGYTLRPGESVHIPIWSIHHDEKYFPEPFAFRPERFLDPKNHDMIRLAFMPFGAGPRICIGRRYAMVVMKCLLFHLMTDMEFVEGEKTQYPKFLNMYKTCIDIKSGLWIGFQPRLHT